jgi:diadenosine tetraphosphate (Ap4A) HIT family hydrolase
VRRATKEEAFADMAKRFGSVTSPRGCVMCALARGERDRALVVREEEHAVVVLDRYAASRGHLLVVVRPHVERVADLRLPHHLEIQRTVWQANVLVEQVLRPRRVYSATLGSSSPAGAAPNTPSLATSFPHLHVHVVPVHEDGEDARPAVVFSWSASLWLYEDAEAETLASELRAAWPT